MLFTGNPDNFPSFALIGETMFCELSSLESDLFNESIDLFHKTINDSHIALVDVIAQIKRLLSVYNDITFLSKATVGLNSN